MHVNACSFQFLNKCCHLRLSVLFWFWLFHGWPFDLLASTDYLLIWFPLFWLSTHPMKVIKKRLNEHMNIRGTSIFKDWNVPNTSSLVYSKTSSMKITCWCACAIIDLRNIYIFVYHTWFSELFTNSLFVVFLFFCFFSTMYTEIIGLQEWIENSCC